MLDVFSVSLACFSWGFVEGKGGMNGENEQKEWMFIDMMGFQILVCACSCSVVVRFC